MLIPVSANYSVPISISYRICKEIYARKCDPAWGNMQPRSCIRWNRPEIFFFSLTIHNNLIKSLFFFNHPYQKIFQISHSIRVSCSVWMTVSVIPLQMPFLQSSSHVYNVIVALVWDDFLKPDLWWPLYSEQSYLTRNLSWAEVAMSLRLLAYKTELKAEIIWFQNNHCTSLQMRYFYE